MEEEGKGVGADGKPVGHRLRSDVQIKASKEATAAFQASLTKLGTASVL